MKPCNEMQIHENKNDLKVNATCSRPKELIISQLEVLFERQSHRMVIIAGMEDAEWGR